MGLIIGIIEPNSYKKANIRSNQRFNSKLIYLFYKIYLDIIFIINKLNGQKYKF